MVIVLVTVFDLVMVVVVPLALDDVEEARKDNDDGFVPLECDEVPGAVVSVVVGGYISMGGSDNSVLTGAGSGGNIRFKIIDLFRVTL